MKIEDKNSIEKNIALFLLSTITLCFFLVVNTICSENFIPNKSVNFIVSLVPILCILPYFYVFIFIVAAEKINGIVNLFISFIVVVLSIEKIYPGNQLTIFVIEFPKDLFLKIWLNYPCPLILFIVLFAIFQDKIFRIFENIVKDIFNLI